jgi:large subunit ribosomal protein L23
MFVIKKTHQTEKAFSLNKDGKYAFIVDINATKNEIKKKIASMYNVVVVAVNTSLHKSKKVKRYTRARVIEGKRARYKKAIVTLREGDIIDVYAEN